MNLPKTQAQRIESVDALRGIASVAVCFFHLSNGATTFLPDGALKLVGSFGWLGVEVFFVISGFIIPYSLYRASYGPRHYGTFVLKRIVRLDPPYLAAIALIIPLGYLSAMAPGFQGPPYHVTTLQVVLHLAYLNVFFGENWLNPVFWTLAVEFQYYLLVGLLYPWISHRSFGMRLTLFALLGSLAFLIPTPAFIPHWFFLFMFGMLVFQCRVGLTTGIRFWVVATLLACGASFTLGLMIAATGLAAAFGIIFWRTSNRALLFLGTISYSLYLIHVPVGAKAVNLASRFADGMGGKVFVLLLGLILSISAAFVLYRLVEKPAQVWSSLMRYRKQTSKLDEKEDS